MTADEALTLAALADVLIPPDQDPGGSEAGVVSYIDRQLARKYKRHLPVYHEALRNLRAQGFASLDSARQAQIVSEWENGAARPSFELILAHTMQGYYGSPRHGGNRDYASWRMLGVPPLPVRGRLHYESRPERS
ncbi:MAG: gluconate 2-dehydrogenase subunit 3 family protein [Bryobacterales bacterium]|nr:gluconate 2-dehydrogenase subunit 3 family protein [Bryobacterales bacterium]